MPTHSSNMDLGRIQTVVGEWSHDNFGEQTQLAPLLGVAEELGETMEATEQEEIVDGIGDVAIYLMDYTYRVGISLDHVNLKLARPADDQTRYEALFDYYSQLAHSALKVYQGIRLDEDGVGPDAERQIIKEFFIELQGLARENDTTVQEAIEYAWYGEVQDRTW